MATQVKNNSPFFMQVSHYANHDHLMARPETLKKFQNIKKGDVHKNVMYAAMTADLDEGIGLLLKKVKELGIEDNTYIIFTSDNGGIPRLPPNRIQYEKSLNHPLQRGKWDLTEGGIRVPLLVKGPGIKKNTQSDIPVIGYDFLPTILELAGNKKEILNIDGASFAPVLKNNGSINRSKNGIIFHYPHYNHFGLGEPHSVLIKDDYKLIKMQASKKTYLFNLKNDAEEKNNVKNRQLALAKKLEQQLDNYLELVDAEQMQHSKNWLRGEGATLEKFPFDPKKPPIKGFLDGYDSFQAVIDLNKNKTKLNHNASGFFLGIQQNIPNDSLLKALKPKLYRGRITDKNGNSGIPIFRRMKNLGADIQIIVSEEYNQSFQNNNQTKKRELFHTKIDKWPGDNNNWSRWESVIEESFKKLQIEGLGKNIQWDFWTAPNQSFNPFDSTIKNNSKLNKTRFFESYKKAYLKVRKLNRKAVIIGPSTDEFDPLYLKEFLVFAKQHNVLPNYLSWQESSNGYFPQQIPIHVNKAKLIMKKSGIYEIPIQINEYVSSNRQTSVNQQIFYLTNLERSKAHRASRNCFENNKLENSFSDCSETLGGLVTEKKKQPKATYWPYKYYGEMSGHLINVKNLPKSIILDGIANLDDKHKKIRILLGRTGNSSRKKLTIRIDNLNNLDWLKKKESLKVSIRNIPNSKEKYLEEPKVSFQNVFIISKNHIDIDLFNFKKQEGIYIEIE